MLPGHIAGLYTRAECHIDLNRLARFAKARGASYISYIFIYILR